MDGPIELDRRSYLGLGRARFTVAGSEPRRAFKRLGTVSGDFREVLRHTPDGDAGVRKYYRLLFLGYICSIVAAITLGLAIGSGLLVDVLAAIDPKEMTPFLVSLRQYLALLPWRLLALAALPLFVLAFILDYQAYRSILETVDALNGEPS